MPNIFRREPGKWWPDADPTNAPPGALLRADNTIPDENGARALRKGTALIYGNLLNDEVHTLFTPTLQGTVYRLAGIDDRLYRPVGSAIEDFGTPFDGSGDFAHADDSYQAFVARGKTKKKFDGSTLNNWGLKAPISAPSLTAVTAVTTEVATFDGANAATPESPAFVQKDGTLAAVAGYDGSTEGAIKLTPDALGRASATKAWSSDQNFFDIKGTAGGDTDLFDMRAFIEEPRVVEKIRVMFGLGTALSSDCFQDDYYYFDWNLRDKVDTEVKDAASQSFAAYKASTNRLLMPLSAQEITNVKRPEDAGRILKRIGRYAGSRSEVRMDTSEASPSWGHLTVTRGQFIRVGNTAGRDWKTVTAMKIVYTVTPGYTKTLYCDNAVWAGGGSRALTGRYRLGFRWARRFLDTSSNEVYTELSPMSPITDEIVLNQQGLQFTVDSTTLNDKDPQTDQMWVYVMGGFLDTFYRCGIYSAFINTGMTIDELTNPSGSNFELKSERTRLTTHGFTRITGGTAANANLTATVNKSEMDMMVENELFEPGSIAPPDNIISICGPWNGRMFVLTSEGWLYPSSMRHPSSFSVYHAIDLRRYGTPYWAVVTAAGGIFVGCSKDIVRIAGSGEESETHVTVDLYPEPLGVANPPVGREHAMDGNVVLYRSADGLMFMSSGSIQAAPETGVSLLWRGYERHGVGALNITGGRFRFAFDNHNIYMLAPENATNPSALWKYLPQFDQWARYTYKLTDTTFATPLSLCREPDGSLLMGTADGQVWELEIGEQDETETATAGITAKRDIDVDIRFPWDDGGNSLMRKVAADYQIHVLTMGDTGTATFYKDGDEDDDTATKITFATGDTAAVYRAALTDLGKFLRVRQRISGAFNRFVLHATNITYRPVPQQVMVLDSGYILPANGGEMAWPVEVALDCVSAANLSMQIYKDDVLFDTLPITVRAARRSEYIITMPRESKARRVRLIFLTTNADGASDPGFEPYGVRVRHRGSGSWVELPAVAPDQSNL